MFQNPAPSLDRASPEKRRTHGGEFLSPLEMVPEIIADHSKSFTLHLKHSRSQQMLLRNMSGTKFTKTVISGTMSSNPLILLFIFQDETKKPAKKRNASVIKNSMKKTF